VKKVPSLVERKKLREAAAPLRAKLAPEDLAVVEKEAERIFQHDPALAYERARCFTPCPRDAEEMAKMSRRAEELVGAIADLMLLERAKKEANRARHEEGRRRSEAALAAARDRLSTEERTRLHEEAERISEGHDGSRWAYFRWHVDAIKNSEAHERSRVKLIQRIEASLIMECAAAKSISS
jgi:hypothetical protein